MADTTWYFIGDGVLGSGSKCVNKGGKIPPSLLTKERLQHFVNCGKVSGKPISNRKNDTYFYGDYKKELAEKNQAIKELNEAGDQLKELFRLMEKERDDWKKKYEDLKKKCKNK